MFESFSVNESSGIPVWMQIRNYTTYLIRSGEAKPGDVLPTVRELAVQLGVNYNTVHKAYRDLEADGLINAGRGKRSTIAAVETDSVEIPESPIDGLLAEVVKVASASGMTKEDVIMRIDLQFSNLDQS